VINKKVLVIFLYAGGAQGVTLSVGALLSGADPHVANQSHYLDPFSFTHSQCRF
jgi:hypothetical protein